MQKAMEQAEDGSLENPNRENGESSSNSEQNEASNSESGDDFFGDSDIESYDGIDILSISRDAFAMFLGL